MIFILLAIVMATNPPFFCSKHPFRSAFRSPSTSRLKGSGLGDSTTPSSLRHLRYLRVYEAIGHELIWIDLALDR